MNRNRQLSEAGSVLYKHINFVYTYRMFRSDFEVDGSFREIWLRGRNEAWPNSFFNTLNQLNLHWKVGEKSYPTVEGISDSLKGSDAIRIYLLQEIELYAYAWQSNLEEMETYVDPKEVSPTNCAQLFEFMKNVGRALNISVYLGDDGRGQQNTTEPDHPFLGYDPQNDSFRRLHPPVELSPPTRIF